jgi:hypothetical protein
VTFSVQHGNHEATAGTLDEYLSRFRAPDAEIRYPAARHAPQRRWQDAKGTSRAYYLAKEKLPAPAFDLAMRGYDSARRLVGRSPGAGRMLPDFLIVGAAKGGTTSLFDWLCEHPVVARPTTDGRLRKELLFFDYQYDRGTEWYRTHFPLEQERRDFELRHGARLQTGEATASYLSGHWVPERVRKLIPEVKLIVSLRNPVDRAYSAFHMSRRRSLEECERFESALALEASRLAPELARVHADRWYAPPAPAPLGYWSYLQRSRYAEHVARWLEYFPREQFLFLEFEQLAADPQATLDRVYAFLGLPAHAGGRFPKLNAGSYGEMDRQTRAHLVEYFRPHNARLRELTGVNFGWDA